MSVNKIFILGRLGAAPTIRQAGEKQVACDGRRMSRPSGIRSRHGERSASAALNTLSKVNKYTSRDS
jgi:hypothetical protein